MRVDSQLDDKDLREKMRLMKEYSPMDLGVEKDFSMMPPAANNARNRVIDEASFSNPHMVSINQSGLNNSELNLHHAHHTHSLIETQD